MLRSRATAASRGVPAGILHVKPLNEAGSFPRLSIYQKRGAATCEYDRIASTTQLPASSFTPIPRFYSTSTPAGLEVNTPYTPGNGGKAWRGRAFQALTNHWMYSVASRYHPLMCTAVHSETCIASPVQERSSEAVLFAPSLFSTPEHTAPVCIHPVGYAVTKSTWRQFPELRKHRLCFSTLLFRTVLCMYNPVLYVKKFGREIVFYLPSQPPSVPPQPSQAKPDGGESYTVLGRLSPFVVDMPREPGKTRKVQETPSGLGPPWCLSFLVIADG
ncbi:hypothetical protein V496_03547 [Pseudogymnoascus sp. VKM F-4515 (FW-2607)]|nr:hypothetical protein V496_03547 [Pseudogymnoascus sp. VKM F-4515 (FW-2607)]